MFEELLVASKLALQNVDTYLSFAENQLARAAVTRLHPARRSPLPGSITLIHGPEGVGKTHLALHTLKQLTHRQPKLVVAYASVNELCDTIQRAEERQSLADFLEFCQTLDVLVCDDLTWLTQSPAFQSGFMMLIEALEQGSTQILLTSRKPVGELRSIDQRLVSRCHGGLCVPMPMCSLESRIQLLQHWFRELKLPILKPFAASAKYLAERMPLSPRGLRQAVQELAEEQSRHPAAIDVAYLQSWLSTANRSPRLSFDAIVLQVAREFGVEPMELRSRSRQQDLAVARQCAMWLARELTGRPLEQIGDYFGRSHTTVSHSLSRLKDLLPSAPSLRQQVHKLRQQLKELPREDCA